MPILSGQTVNKIQTRTKSQLVESFSMDGVSRCSRYAFGPNRLHLCGPDLNKEVLAYISEGVSDTGLTNILEKFNTLFPYLSQIAQSNHIKDPFDHRVVEAYWIGNKLLDSIPAKTYYHHLKENLKLHKKGHVKQFQQLTEKLPLGALMHHSFHVFNVWHRTGHNQTEHTIESLDKCRISSGVIKKISGPLLTVSRSPIILQDGRLIFGKPQTEKLHRRLETSSLLDNVSVGDTVSIHWDLPCEILSPAQVQNLKHYTTLSLTLANKTI